MLEEMYINVDMDKIPKFTKLAGVSFNNRQDFINDLSETTKIELVRDYKNKYDRCAIGVYNGNVLVGWIPKYISEKLAPEIDSGIRWTANIKNITGIEKDTKGVNIELVCLDN